MQMTVPDSWIEAEFEGYMVVILDISQESVLRDCFFPSDSIQITTIFKDLFGQEHHVLISKLTGYKITTQSQTKARDKWYELVYDDTPKEIKF